MNCSKCGAKVTEEMAFCPKCGAPLKTERPPEKPAAAPTPTVYRGEKAERGDSLSGDRQWHRKPGQRFQYTDTVS